MDNSWKSISVGEGGAEWGSGAKRKIAILVRPAGIHFGSMQVIRMLTSVDIVGHLAGGVWILGRFICFFPSLF